MISRRRFLSTVMGTCLLGDWLPVLEASTAEPYLPVQHGEGTTRFIVFGDSGSGSMAQYELAWRMEALRERIGFEFVVMLGDQILKGNHEYLFSVLALQVVDNLNGLSPPVGRGAKTLFTAFHIRLNHIIAIPNDGDYFRIAKSKVVFDTKGRARRSFENANLLEPFSPKHSGFFDIDLIRNTQLVANDLFAQELLYRHSEIFPQQGNFCMARNHTCQQRRTRSGSAKHKQVGELFHEFPPNRIASASVCGPAAFSVIQTRFGTTRFQSNADAANSYLYYLLPDLSPYGPSHRMSSRKLTFPATPSHSDLLLRVFAASQRRSCNDFRR